MQRTLTVFVILLLFCGCAHQKPFSALPAEQRQSSRLFPCKGGEPQVRFNAVGARQARTFAGMGGLVGMAVGFSVAESIEKNNTALQVIRGSTGNFEKTLIEEQFRSRLPAEIREPTEGGTNYRLQLCLLAVGLREIDRGQFAPFAHGVASLHSPNGKELWKAQARSVGTKPHSLEAFGSQPGLYRKDFEEVAVDLASQLIDGPVREIRD
jgi:hypothetical protein